ncbi:plasmid stability protein y4jJ [Xanthobacteraceae bacterium Astr-EGSB]|uniref:FitA-like ribbon-helix-helix domain-containing protein n=1 Tax=Astrobacterium formosum TaxID=3069710 RepID=UPI0027B708F9|nr:plasmid stability protein y4jJ [Xanthobacteraceae bacterium Astr-EGSB]
MADILIRKVDETTKKLLHRRAERRGKSLEADLRDTLEELASEEMQSSQDAELFGDWLVSISRPGVDLDDTLKLLRSATVRPATPE